MFRLHGISLAFRALHRITGPLQLRLPVPVKSLGGFRHVRQDRQRQLPITLCERRQHVRIDTSIEAAGWDGPTDAALAISPAASGALVDRAPPPCSIIADGHAPPTSSAEYEPWSESCPLPGHTTSPHALKIQMIPGELLAIRHRGLPRNIGRMGLLETHGPLLRWTRQGTDARALSLCHHGLTAPTPIDIGSGIGRVMQAG